jgi:hypothetical protein
MKSDLARAFADITANLEDLAGIAVEGQRRDNTPDMHRVLAFQLRAGIAAVDLRVGGIMASLDRAGR